MDGNSEPNYLPFTFRLLEARGRHTDNVNSTLFRVEVCLWQRM